MKTGIFLVMLVLEYLGLAWMFIVDGRHGPVSAERTRDDTLLVEVLRITDLALWSEARYTRHPSQADRFTAFQIAPAAPDSFPAGTWVPPRPHRGPRRRGPTTKP